MYQYEIKNRSRSLYAQHSAVKTHSTFFAKLNAGLNKRLNVHPLF